MATIVVDALTEFFDAIRSPVTKDRYEKRLDIFSKHIKVPGATLKAWTRAGMCPSSSHIACMTAALLAWSTERRIPWL